MMRICFKWYLVIYTVDLSKYRYTWGRFINTGLSVLQHCRLFKERGNIRYFSLLQFSEVIKENVLNS